MCNQWAGHAAKITPAVNSSSVGRKMFGFAEELVTSFNLRETIQKMTEDT